MTPSELQSGVSSYLTAHLDSGFWSGLAAETKTAAQYMAMNDILAAVCRDDLDSIPATCKPFIHAVAEQAVYLARNHDSLAEGKITTSEGVDGISASYTLIGNPGISHRAMKFIDAARRQIMGGTVRISRG